MVVVVRFVLFFFILCLAVLGVQTQRTDHAPAKQATCEELTHAISINQLSLLKIMGQGSYASIGVAEWEARRVEAAARDARLQEMETRMEDMAAMMEKAAQETAKGVAAQLAALRQEMMSEVMSLLKMDNTVTSPPEVPELAACPDGWLRRESSCYLIAHDTGRIWEDCLAYCRGLGGDLAKITSTEENEFIGPHGREGWGYWIGLKYRAREGRYVWTDNSAATYTPWGGGQPDDRGRGHDCVYMARDGDDYTWWDGPCSLYFYGGCVCERAVHA